MDIEEKPDKDLANELESLRSEISHLLNMIQNPAKDNSAESKEESAFRQEWDSDGLLSNGPFGIVLIDRNLRIVSANQAFNRMLGLAPNEPNAGSFLSLVRNPQHCKKLINQILQGISNSSIIEDQVYRKNGEAFWVQITASGRQTSSESECCLIIENIDERKSKEIALDNEKCLLERLINSSVDGILAFDRNGFITVWNPAMERIFGISAAATLGRPMYEACYFLKELGEDINLTAALQGKHVVSKDKRYSIPGVNKFIYFEGYYGPMYKSGNGEIAGGLAIIRDVTESRIAEEGKRNSENRYRELFENAYDIVYTLDLTGKITSINKAAERLLGYSRTEALRMRFNQFVAPEHQSVSRRMIDRQISDEVPTTQELELVSKDKAQVIVEVSNRLIYREGKPIGVQGIARNITERKKAEAALQQANKKLEAWVKELEQRTRELTLLSELGDILRACLTTEEVYEVIVRVAKELFPLQGGALFVLGPLRNIVEAVAEWGDNSRIEPMFSPDECWALRRGRAHWVEDTRTGLLCRHIATPMPQGYLCVPMMAQSEAVGVLYLAQLGESPMTEAKQRLATAMAEHVAMALSNLKLHETLRTQSIRDQLTGLFNRSFMEESLELELRRAVRSQSPLSVIMLELDNFQLINENYGLDVGDSILRKTGLALQSKIRKGDIACRYTGQTYVVVLPQSDYEIGTKRSEIFCNLVRALDVTYQHAQVGRVTCSIGLAAYPINGQTVENLLRSSEAALARAKNSGGDCVVVAN